MMSVSSFSNFSILIKKIARKSSLRRFTNTKKQRAQSCLHKTTNTTIQDQDIGSISTCSSNEEENNINNNKSVLKNVPVTTKTEKQQQQQKDNLINNNTNNNKDPTLSSKKSLDTISSSRPPQTTTVITKTEENDEESIDQDTIQVSIHNNDDEDENDDNNNNNDNNKHDDIPKIKIRDFGYATTSPLHHGPPPSLIDYQSSSQISLSSTRFNGRQARALYDFIPETDYEMTMNAGQSIWIQYRQCDGWLMAEIGDETGLVPESYIEFI